MVDQPGPSPRTVIKFNPEAVMIGLFDFITLVCCTVCIAISGVYISYTTCLPVHVLVSYCG